MRDDNWTTVAKLKEVTRHRRTRFHRPKQRAGFKLAICGSRHLDLKLATKLIREHYPLALKAFKAKRATAIISGGATGVDRAAANLAHKLTGSLAYLFLADWTVYGNMAGPIRNALITQEADGLLLIWDGKSHGSRDVRYKFGACGKPIYEVEVEIAE